MGSNKVLLCDICSFEFDELSVITLAEKGTCSYNKLCDTNVAEKETCSYNKLCDTNVANENLRFKLESNQVLLCEICSFEIEVLSPEKGHHSFYKLCDKVTEENLIAKCRNWVNENEFVLPRNYPSEQSVNCKKPLKNFKKELKRLENLFSFQRDEISKSILELSTRLEVTRKDFSKLQEIKRSKDIYDERKLETLISEMKNDYEETQKILGFDRSTSKEQLDSTNSFENLIQLNEFLPLIYNKLLNDEEIFTVFEIGNETKYGKISIQENVPVLFFHALDLSQVPTKASLINFGEVKPRLQSKSCGVFITISLKKNKPCKIIMEVSKNHQSNKVVVGLCLGEFGSSYKNAVQIGYGSKFMLMDVILEQNSGRFNCSKSVDCFSPQNSDGVLNDYSFVNIPPNTVFAHELLNDGSFSLVTSSTSVNDRFPEDAFGVVISPLNIRELLSSENIPTVTIRDCGVVLSVI